MKKIVIISASVRVGRDSHRVALYFQNLLKQSEGVEVELLDLEAYNFPIFDERLRFMPSPTEKVLEFTNHIKQADGVLIVTPEYNGGYPASLKNVIDLLYDEWKRKPIAVATASAGVFGGTQVITSLVFTLFKIGVTLVPSTFPVPKIKEMFTVDGYATDDSTNKRAQKFLSEFYWYIDAVNGMKTK